MFPSRRGKVWKKSSGCDHFLQSGSAVPHPNKTWPGTRPTFPFWLTKHFAKTTSQSPSPQIFLNPSMLTFLHLQPQKLQRFCPPCTCQLLQDSQVLNLTAFINEAMIFIQMSKHQPVWCQDYKTDHQPRPKVPSSLVDQHVVPYRQPMTTLGLILENVYGYLLLDNPIILAQVFSLKKVIFYLMKI